MFESTDPNSSRSQFSSRLPCVPRLAVWMAQETGLT